MADAIHYSRPERAADTLGDQAPGKHQFINKEVLLEADSNILRSKNGELCFLFCLYLLPRFCAQVSIYIPESDDKFSETCRVEADRIVSSGELAFVREVGDRSRYTAILHVGSFPTVSSRNTVMVNSNGWLARVSRSQAPPASTDQTNAVGALAAASWACSEVFKLLVNLREERGRPFELVEYSLFNYAHTSDPGPQLPEVLPIARTLLLGFGAIGNAVVAVAHKLPLLGNLDVVDYQQFGPENLGTCMLIGPKDISRDKALVAERWSSGHLTIRGHAMRLEKYLSLVDESVPHPWIVLTAPDSSEPRREAQKLWPDIAINGAIGEFEVDIGVHPAEGDVACLRCLYEPRKSFDWAAEVSKATGLALQRIAKDGDSLVSIADVELAPEEHKEWLAKQVGEPICSIAEEGLARRISNDEEISDEFRPSLPFVASLSAAFMCAELMKYAMGHPTNVLPRIQHDILQGPATALTFPQKRSTQCECKTRAGNIANARAMWKAKSGSW